MTFSHKRHRHVLYSGAFLVLIFLLSLTPRLNQNITELKEGIVDNIFRVEGKRGEVPGISYVIIKDSCDFSYTGACVNVRTGPSINAPVLFKARNGMVLRIQKTVTDDAGRIWYKISFNEWLRYPERLVSDAYIAAEYVNVTNDEGDKELTNATTLSETKYIIVDRSEQILYAYERDTLFMKEKVSTGIQLTPTPRGNFTIYRKTPSRYMQGPIPDISDHYYDLPGVPWNLYFTEEGAVIHGAYWHNSFGKVWSNGCVNLKPESAERLYKWADTGVRVTVRD